MDSGEISAADVDIDYLDASAWDGRAHERMRWLRHNAPVYWAPKSDLFVLSKYDDIRFVSKNPDLVASGLGNQIEDPLPGQLENTRSMITMDPPAHPRYRKLVSQGFTPKAVARMEQQTRGTGRASLSI